MSFQQKGCGLMAEDAVKSTVPTLQRGMEILEFLGRTSGAKSIAEISEQLGYPTASVFRITQEFAGLGYLLRDPVTKRFSLTNKFLLLGQPQNASRGFVESALTAMRKIHRATRETVQLCCLVETQVVILEQLISTHPFKYSAQLGARCPAFSSAPGKAIIAMLPPDEQEEVISRIRFKKYTESTLHKPALFRSEINRVAEMRYAVDRSEGLEGIHCVATPLLDRNGYPIGAITIAGPSSRIPEVDFASIGEFMRTVVGDSQDDFQE
ncbi:IclR family transcriptional regulator [Planctomicrobium sp. SH668]|uniref:IclR family transcriptional regulator n=1 Tax=Planctomicrobium sp. SH668 TaxID=3448126 RepID=UPI003F5C9966